MIISGKAISRRTLLRGLGVSLALPMLDAMVPAFARAATIPTARRLGIVYAPHGMSMDLYRPKTEGALELSPVLQPLAPFKDRVLVLGGLDCRPAEGHDAGVHPRCQTAWATEMKPTATEGLDLRAGMSWDQIAAHQLGKETQLSSLELALETPDLGGSCGVGYSCAYSSTIAWRDATTPLPMENNPRAVFERLFGASDHTDSKSRLDLIERDRSILDGVTAKLERLRKTIGVDDKRKIEQYADAVREVERRIQKAEEQVTNEVPVVDRPAGVPETFEAHAKLMYDLLALAYQTDMTRVATYLVAREQSVRTYPEIGVPDPAHQLSHHLGLQEKLEKIAKVNAFHLSMFAYFVEKLRATPDGAGSLLDSTLLMFGCGMSDSNDHLMYDLPTIVVGNETFHLKGGRHIRYPKGTPLANLQRTLLARVGVRVEQFGDSTGDLGMLDG